MAEEPLVSDVHCGLNSRPSGQDKVLSTFSFTRPQWLLDIRPNLRGNKINYVDEDGDPIIKRNNDEDLEIVIEHCLASDLASVGLQVWKGCLHLSDYILANPHEIRSKNVLELGAGTGIVATISDLCQPQMYLATDLPQMMATLRANCARNECSQVVQFEALNLTHQEYDQKFDFDLILAADLVYDFDVTDGIMSLISMWISSGSEKKKKRFLASVEKRYIFTVDDLDTVAPSYDYFCQQLTQLEQQLNSDKCTVEISEIEQDTFKQSFCYDRNKELTLVQVDFVPKV